jgi:DNA-binding CsgD family transcriptional regulator
VEDLSNVLLALYQASREVPPDQFQDWVLALIKRCLPFDSSWWGSATMTDGGADIHALHLHNFPNREEFVDAYFEVADEDVARRTIMSGGSRVFSFDPAVYAARKAFGFRAFQKRHDIEYGLVGSAFDAKTRMARWISLFRAPTGFRFTDTECQWTAQVLPHVLEALEINRLTHLEHIAGGSGRRYFLAIADTRGVVHHAEAGFLELARANDVVLPTGRIDDEVLRRLAVDGRYVAPGAVVLAARKVDLLFLRARPRAAADALSRREREIARLVAEGRTHKEIARALRITPATARNHIAAIHAKTGVRNNAELAGTLVDSD